MLVRICAWSCLAVTTRISERFQPSASINWTFGKTRAAQGYAYLHLWLPGATDASAFIIIKPRAPLRLGTHIAGSGT